MLRKGTAEPFAFQALLWLPKFCSPARPCTLSAAGGGRLRRAGGWELGWRGERSFPGLFPPCSICIVVWGTQEKTGTFRLKLSCCTASPVSSERCPAAAPACCGWGEKREPGDFTGNKTLRPDELHKTNLLQVASLYFHSTLVQNQPLAVIYWLRRVRGRL